ncbi:MAG: PAS domain S-box protein, partial [Nitrospira sp.]|nr:PAS domain S-box protein [Nitrospira sp.]
MRESILFVVNAALTATLFVLDIQTPLGFTNHTLYATVIVISAASQFPWIPSLTAGIGTICTIIGYFYSPHSLNIPQWIPVGNRLFTITILWTLVWFIRQRRSAEITLQNTNELLERKVEDRTRNLREVTQVMASEIEVRRRAEEAYRSTEDRLAGILDIAEDAIIVADSSRTITLFNQGAVKLFGYTSVEILGQSLDRLLPERFRNTHSQHIDTFAHSTESSRLLAQPREVFGLKRDGTEFPAEASISKLTVGASNTFTVILRDISARIRTESQLRSLTTQLITVQEQERSRISRELHDDINQR